MSASAVQTYINWDEGLLALCGVLANAERTRIVIARLAKTAEANGFSAEDICALALTIPPAPQFAENSQIAANAPADETQQLDTPSPNELSPLRDDINDALNSMERTRNDREKFVLSAFPDRDVRKILVDTTFGLAAAALADFSQLLAEADPFSRLAQRLALWFKPSTDLTRYGLPWPHDVQPILELVSELLERVSGDKAEPARRLMRIWAGEEEVPRSSEGLKALANLAYELGWNEWGVLAFEICASLIQDCDNAEELAEFERTVGNWILRGRSNPTQRATADLREWLENYRKLDLACDLSGVLVYLAFQAPDWRGESMAIVQFATEELVRVGNAAYPTGPFPMAWATGNFTDGGLRALIAGTIPECADLMRLLDVESTECEAIYGSPLYGGQPHECAEDEDPVSLRWAIDRARRGDFSLCDILIACWLLYCTLLLRSPLPYLSELAFCIRQIPAEDRNSVNSVLSWLRRATSRDPSMKRSVDALLCYLPPVRIAPERDLAGEMREEWFGPRLWDKLAPGEQKRLLRAEELFRELRRRGLDRVDPVELGELFPHWSAVAENLLFRAMCNIDESLAAIKDSEKSLGRLISLVRTAQQSDREGYRRLLPVTVAKSLTKLNGFNIDFGKHIGRGSRPEWNDVIELRSGLYFGGIFTLLMERAIAYR